MGERKGREKCCFPLFGWSENVEEKKDFLIKYVAAFASSDSKALEEVLRTTL